MDLNARQQQLLEDLREVGRHLRGETLDRYQRMNPFAEDLSDWKERGRAWTSDDRDVTIYDSTTVVGDVSIGRGTWVGPFCSLDGTGGLTIGEYCSVSSGCQLLSHDTARWALSGGREVYEYAPTAIGNHCFLGTHVVVTRGVTVGDRCLVAAGAVVTADAAEGSILAGIPARRIGTVDLRGDGSVDLRYS
ncbi:MAG: acyltransferase [Actinomycetota bacterium]|nr:acyltransferase [Actinomycetota bacterium]